MDVEVSGHTRNATIRMDLFVLEPNIIAVTLELLFFTQIVMVTESLTQYVLISVVSWESSKAYKIASPSGLMQSAKIKEPHAALAEDTIGGVVIKEVYSP